jgi:hypothetical protein
MLHDIHPRRRTLLLVNTITFSRFLLLHGVPGSTPRFSTLYLRCMQFVVMALKERPEILKCLLCR